MGWKPSKDPNADELRNKNLSAPKESNSESENNNEEDEETAGL